MTTQKQVKAGIESARKSLTLFRSQTKGTIESARKSLTFFCSQLKGAIESARKSLTLFRSQLKGAIGRMLICKEVRHALLLGSGLLFLPVISSSAAEKPTAPEILKGARFNQSSQHRVLRGQLRTGGEKIPFRLVLNGPEIRYEFSDPSQILVLKMGEQSSRFEEVTKEGSEQVKTGRFDDFVRNSDVTYEDLALRFLYWKDAKIIGDDTIAGISYYKLELHPDGSPSQYGTVRAWIGKRSGALAQAESYGRNGILAAKFTVTSIRPLSDGAYIFKQMRIERMSGGKAKDSTPTYLEIMGELKAQ